MSNHEKRVSATSALIKTIFCPAIAAALFACNIDSSTSSSNENALIENEGAVKDTSLAATNATTNPLGDSSSVNPASTNQGKTPASGLIHL